MTAPTMTDRFPDDMKHIAEAHPSIATPTDPEEIVESLIEGEETSHCERCSELLDTFLQREDDIRRTTRNPDEALQRFGEPVHATGCPCAHCTGGRCNSGVIYARAERR